MNRTKFEQLVSMAVGALPDEFVTKLENIDVVVQEWPTGHQLHRAGLRHSQLLLGLYEGIPQTKRGRHYGLVLPDKITIFQKPIEAECRDEDEIKAAIEKVVKHEIAHHFGIGDEQLEQIEKGRDRKPFSS